MQNRTRNVQIKFWVTPEERKLIEQKMAQLPTKRIGTYMRKMAIDYILNPAKTDGKLLVSSFECSPETADLAFR